MDRVALARSIARQLRLTESVVEFCSLGNAPETVDEYSKPIKDFLQNACALLKDLSRQDHKTQTKKKAAVAQACLDAYHDGNVFSRLEALLAAVPDRAAAVASSSNDPFYRRNAVRVVLYTNLTAFMLLGHACDVLREQLQLQSSSSTLHTRAAERALAAMGGRGLVGAVAAAARGMAATVALVHSEAGQRELADPSNTTLADMFRLCLEQAACMATAVCKHVLLLAQAVKQRLPPPVQAARPGSLLAAPNIPPLVVQLAEALADSELLAAAATVLLDAPPVYKLQHLPDQGRNTFCRDLRNSVENAALSMYYMHNAIECIASLGGSEAQRLACGLLRAMRHVAVRRLQVGLLDRLAAHAGMVAALSEGREEQEGSGLQAGQAGEGQQAESERGGWEGSSGAWWFAREEARRGRLLGKDPAGGGGGQARSRATGAPQEVQEGHHHCVLSATFGEWLWVQRDQVTVAVA